MSDRALTDEQVEQLCDHLQGTVNFLETTLERMFNVSFDDIRRCAHSVLRHRILLNFEGEAEGVRPDAIVDEILEKTLEVEKKVAV